MEKQRERRVIRSVSDLDGHLDRIGKMWARWGELGVTEETELAVDFHFYSTRPPKAEALHRELEDRGFTVASRSTRTLLVFKGTETTGTRSGTWTLERLRALATELHRVAEDVDVIFDGCGAEIPDSATEA